MDNLIPLPLERELMRSFLEPEPGPGDEIEIRSRRLTGVGFYTDLKVNARLRALTAAERPAGPLSGPEIESPQIPHGAGSLLWPHESGIHTLEVFTYVDPFPDDLQVFRLRQP